MCRRPRTGQPQLIEYMFSRLTKLSSPWEPLGARTAGAPCRRATGLLVHAADDECAGHAFLGVPGHRAQIVVGPRRAGGEGKGAGVHPSGGWIGQETPWRG